MEDLVACKKSVGKIIAGAPNVRSLFILMWRAQYECSSIYLISFFHDYASSILDFNTSFSVHVGNPSCIGWDYRLKHAPASKRVQ